MSCSYKHLGIKIVDDNQNKRVSDIFNTKNGTSYENSTINKNNKSRIIEVTEKIIGDKLRTSTPYINGQKNEEFLPQHLNSSIDFTFEKTGGQSKYVSYMKNKRKENLKENKKENKETSIIKSTNNSRNNIFPQNGTKTFLNKSLNEKQFKNVEMEAVGNLEKTLHKSSSELNVKKKDEFKHKTLEELNEKNKLYSEKKKNEKLKINEARIQNATLSLISSSYSQKENLNRQFQNSKSLFDEEFCKDHVLERAKKNYINQQKNNNTAKKGRVCGMDQRLEIVEYYEMNQKFIDKKSNDQPMGERENDNFFQDIKKINVRLHHDVKQQKEKSAGENNTIKTNRQTILNNRDQSNNQSRNASPYPLIKVDTITKLKKDLNASRSKSAVTKNIKPDFIKSKSPIKTQIKSRK